MKENEIPQALRDAEEAFLTRAVKFPDQILGLTCTPRDVNRPRGEYEFAVREFPSFVAVAEWLNSPENDLFTVAHQRRFYGMHGDGRVFLLGEYRED